MQDLKLRFQIKTNHWWISVNPFRTVVSPLTQQPCLVSHKQPSVGLVHFQFFNLATRCLRFAETQS